MLDVLKKWFGAPAPVRGSWRALAAWAERRQLQFRPSTKDDGFIAEGVTGPVSWRLEWGPSQRSYIGGQELRMRAELGLPAELQILLLHRPLAETLEKAVFAEYVESVQTSIDSSMPPEMRWLVMFPKVPGYELKALRERYAAIASHKAWLLHWLDSVFADELMRAPGPADAPVIWMIARGRLMLRVALPEAGPESVERWLLLFETALRQARLTQAEIGDAVAPSTPSSLWPASGVPGEPPR